MSVPFDQMHTLVDPSRMEEFEAFRNEWCPLKGAETVLGQLKIETMAHQVVALRWVICIAKISNAHVRGS